jgi:hypothetical protein
MKKLFNSNPLYFSFFLPIIVDVVGTVLGQPKEYWLGDFKVVNEALPLYILLNIHPLLFLAFCLVFWLTCTYFLTKKLPHFLKLWAALALFVGHGYNSITWLRINQYHHGILAGRDQVSQFLALAPMTIYIFLISFIAAKCFKKYMEDENERNS